MSDLESKLEQLIIETCQHPAGSSDRTRGLTQIIRIIRNSGKLWREYIPEYEDALQQTWLYFCRNLCEAATGKVYNPQQANVITWLNAYLKRRLQDFRLEVKVTEARTVSTIETDDGGDAIANIAAPASIPPLLEAIQQWANTNRELHRVYVQNRPEINAQILILRRLPPEASWQVLAQEFDISPFTLSSFYRRQCIPLLRQFCEQEEYL